MTGVIAAFSGALLLVSAWIAVRAEMSARRHFPLQFTDDLSSRYYMMYVLFDRSIPLEVRRRIGISTALAIVAFAGFAAVAYLADRFIVAALLLLIGGHAVANAVKQWRSRVA
jgi:hypothetical protein